MATPSPTLSLTQSQRLQMILAPQLRQSLEMLQLPVLELRNLIQQELERNPTIEDAVVQSEPLEIEPSAAAGAGEAAQEQQTERQPLDFDKEFEALAKLDDEWRDYFFQDLASRPYSEDDEEKRQYLLDSLPQRESLQEHLMRQLELGGLAEEDRKLGELIIGSINDEGYLTSSLAELAATTGHDPQRLEDVLATVQDFHPVGVGARDLRECLLLQLERQDKGDTLAARIVRDHLAALGDKQYLAIAKALGVSVDEVQQAAKMIAALDPTPGRTFAPEQANYVVPEVFVQKVDGRYVVLMNDEQLPHVRISSYYRKLMEDPATAPEVRSYIQDKIRSGAFLIKSIHQRQRTIQRIAAEIVKTQEGFLDHGVSHLKPLTMAQVARVVGVHETTVSRAVSGKYMQTPVGLFEMKYFFTPGIKTAAGTEVSNKTVKDMIAGLVAREDPEHPLSDQELMERLKEQGIHIARRTIAKYRLMLRIPPSHLRK